MKFTSTRFLAQCCAAGVAASVLAAFSAFAQTTSGTGAVTVPVGFMTYTIPAAVNGTPRSVAISLPLHDTPVYTGAVTDVGDSTLGNSSAPWTDSAYSSSTAPYFVRIRTGAQAGRVLLITANTTSQLTVNTRVPALPLTQSGQAVVPGDTIDIIPADTLVSLFGGSDPVNNPPILQSGDVNSADVIRVWNDAQRWDAYYYDSTQGTWVNITSGANANNTVVYPDRALFITRRGTTDVSFTLTGQVPASDQKTQVGRATPGAVSSTLTGNLFPVDTTLAATGISNLPNWAKNTDFNSADVVRVWSPAQRWVAYYHDGTQWVNQQTGANADSTAIAAGSAVFITRRSSPTADLSVWNNPLPYSLN